MARLTVFQIFRSSIFSLSQFNFIKCQRINAQEITWNMDSSVFMVLVSFVVLTVLVPPAPPPPRPQSHSISEEQSCCLCRKTYAKLLITSAFSNVTSIPTAPLCHPPNNWCKLFASMVCAFVCSPLCTPTVASSLRACLCCSIGSVFSESSAKIPCRGVKRKRSNPEIVE